MNWLIFAIFAYVFVALQEGLRSLLLMGGVSPSLLLVLAVFIGLLAPSSAVGWSMLILGMLADLMSSAVPGGPVLGPIALGYLVGAFAVVQLRGLVFRESVFTLTVMVFAVGLFVLLVEVAVLTMRGLPWLTGQPIAGWSAANALYRGFLELLYTSIVAIPVGYVLLKTTSMWGFAGKKY